MTRSKADRRGLGDAKLNSSSLKNDDCLDITDSVSHSDNRRSENWLSMLAAILTLLDVVGKDRDGW